MRGCDKAAFRFQLAHDQSFKDVVIDESSLKTKQLILTDLPIGNYWWRIVVADVRDGQVHFDSGPAQSFEVAGG